MYSFWHASTESGTQGCGARGDEGYQCVEPDQRRVVAHNRVRTARGVLRRRAQLGAVLDGLLRREQDMRAAVVTVAVLALALRVTPGAPADQERQVTALAPQDIRWFTPPYYAST